MIKDVSKELLVKAENVDDIKFDPVQPWARYLLLEKAFLEYLQYVPFKQEHYNVTSPYLDDLLIRSCSLLESFWKTAIMCNSIERVFDKDILERHRKDLKKVGINQLEEIFNKKFNLNSCEIHYIYGEYNHSFLPFEKWSKNNSPKWWATYNKLKHIGLQKSVTYKEVRDALGGVFLAIVTHFEMLQYLGAISTIREVGSESGGMSAFDLCLSYPNYSKAGSSNSIVVKTQLFGNIYNFFEDEYHFNKDEFIKRVFTPPYDPRKDYRLEEEWIKSVMK